MAEADALQQQLLAAQNSDGGWGYGTGSSWTEPTALALLALEAAGPAMRWRGSEVKTSAEWMVHGAPTVNTAQWAACQCATEWLVRSQRNDGGWAPQPAVDQSTWVSSIAALALPANGSTLPPHCRGISWVVRQVQPGEAPMERFLARLQGNRAGFRPPGGSSWFPGTAAWIAPTAMATLALLNETRKNKHPALCRYVADNQQFILSRRCRDGGWNHGGGKYRSENANSYPEMTGMALLALQGVNPRELLLPLARATDFVQSPSSLEALSWLQLGLLAHGRDYRALKTELPCRTIRDLSLRLLALAGNGSDNKLLASS